MVKATTYYALMTRLVEKTLLSTQLSVKLRQVNPPNLHRQVILAQFDSLSTGFWTTTNLNACSLPRDTPVWQANSESPTSSLRFEPKV